MKKKDTRKKVEVGVNAFTAQATAERKPSDLNSGLVEKNPPEPVKEESGRTQYPDSYPRELIRPMGDKEIEKVTDAVLGAMTFSEKVELLHSMGEAPRQTGCSAFVCGVPRLGVPAMVQCDGPSGPNTIYETTNLPVELLAGCTFSPELAYQYGTVLGRDLKSAGGNWQLGSQLDVVRSPYWLRSRDTYGEDYYLNGEMAVQEVRGIQDHGAGAMAKHIGAYSTNGDGGLLLEVDEQTFHTAYLYPFEQAAKRGRVSSMMTTYNRVNGCYTASSTYLNKTVVRDCWNWKGNMTTDAGGNSEVSVHLGTDNEMIYRYNGEPGIRAYLREGLLTMSDIDEAVRHILWGYGVAGYLGLVQIDPDTGLAKDDPGRVDPIMPRDTYYQDRISGQFEADNQIAEEIAEKGAVLLKNEREALPLSRERLKKGVALIGFGAKYPVYGTGFERSQGVQQYIRTPGAAIRELDPEAKLTVEPMEDLLGRLIPAENLFQDEACTMPGLKCTAGILKEDSYTIDYSRPDAPLPPPGGKLPMQEKVQVDVPGLKTGAEWSVDPTLEKLTRSGGFFNGLQGNAVYSGSAFTWKGYLKAEETGETVINLQNMGGDVSIELFDGEEKVIAATGNNSFGHGVQWEFDMPDGEGLSSIRRTVNLEAGKAYRILITANACYPEKDLQLRLNWYTPSMRKKDRERALAAARENSTVIYFARSGVIGHLGYIPGNTITVNNLEDLLAVQAEARKAGNRFIVVMNSRSAFATEGGWLEGTDALIALFYGGQAQNTALAKLLLGEANFSGKLSITLPRKANEVCTHYTEELKEERWGNQQSPMDTFQVKYSEGLDFGYRWNARNSIEPAYPFGYGLSYTRFEYQNVRVEKQGDGFDVTLDVVNAGGCTGDEIVQVYLGEASVPEHIQCAKLQLAGFARVEGIAPGEGKQAKIHVGRRMLSYWDPELELQEREDGTRDKWVLAAGSRELLVGASSREFRFRTTIEVG